MQQVFDIKLIKRLAERVQARHLVKVVKVKMVIFIFEVVILLTIE